MSDDLILHCQQLSKVFHDGDIKLTILDQVNMSVRAGELVAIVGPSGSGKSTLLHLLSGLDQPSSGEISIKGQSIAKLSEKKRCQMRNEKLGFIYQFHHLLAEFSALENVAMPLLIRGLPRKTAFAKAVSALTHVGLSARLTHRPAKLSGGERQRTAIARALVTEPLCVLADEPTGNLDHRTAISVFDNLLALNKRLNTSVLMVTHDLRLAEKMDRILQLEDGLLSEIT